MYVDMAGTDAYDIEAAMKGRYSRVIDGAQSPWPLTCSDKSRPSMFDIELFEAPSSPTTPTPLRRPIGEVRKEEEGEKKGD